jgi:DNA-binding SARP family transcriptional activator
MVSLPLRIRLLGGLDLRLGENPRGGDGSREEVHLPPLESARAESLLAYLLLHRETPQARQHLAFLLWPDSTEAQARTNLRHVLHTLRHALPDPDRWLAVTPRTLQWRPDAPCWLDVAAFEEALARADSDSAEERIAALREASELYAGDLLQGSYDEWLLDERDRLRQRYLEALARLTMLLEARREYGEAILCAEQLLRHDPLHEETYRLLMRLHDARGNRARALRVYHDCTATLERELGVAPSAATREVYEALLPAEAEAAAVEPPDGRVGGASLVGRAVEWTSLTTLWRAAESGHAQLALVSGEPGIGKTRLVEELRSWCVERRAVTAVARSYPAEGALAYAPIVTWLRSPALEVRVERLTGAYRAELARLLPELGAEAPERATPEPLSASEQRRRLFDAVIRVLLAAGGPLLLVADDLQWTDPETLQFLHYLLRTAPEARLLVAATARREEIGASHPLHDLVAGLRLLGRITEIPVDRLGPEETALLAARVAGRPLVPADAAELHAETEGNPLFVVEALRAGWASASEPRRWLTPRVQAVIESRLGQLSPPARELVEIAAAIGREFTPDALACAAGIGEDALVRGLDELWRRRIIREQGAHAYDFSHDKIREVAYLQLSPARRRLLHHSIALGLEQLHAADPDAVSSQIAAQWEHAGKVDRAIAWHQRAAHAAQQRHASADAARLLGRALDLLRTLPETVERDAREMEILAALPAPLWVEGYGSTRLVAVHERALQLAGALGLPLSPPLLRSLAIASLTQGDFAGAQRFGAQLRRRGDDDGDDVLVVEGEYVLGIAAFWQGEFAAARAHFEQAIDRYRPRFRRAHLLEYGLDPKVICLSRLGNTHWFLGDAGAATRARDAALALAEEIGHSHSRETALVFAAMLAIDMRDQEHVRAYATMLTTRREQAARPTQIITDAVAGYVAVLDGRSEEIARIEHVLEETRGIQSEHAPGSRAAIARVLLDACATAGANQSGLAAADAALATGGATAWEAETRRLRAEFLAALGQPEADVAGELERALHVARRQGARSLELRAAVSLLRLRRGRDPSAARLARDAVQAVLLAMPEGHDTPEVLEARSLLA